MSPFANKGGCYESFLNDVQKDCRFDRGLNFHLNRGAKICRKTVEDWIPEDIKNGGYGVLVHYDMVEGTSKVRDKEVHSNKSQVQFLTADALMEEVERSVCEVLDIDKTNLNASTSFMDLGLDSLSLNELAANLNSRLNETVDISATMLFKHPCIGSLSTYVQKRMSAISDDPFDLSQQKDSFSNNI